MDARQRLTIVPITLREARCFIAKHHRHLKPPVGHIFSVAVTDNQAIVGVATVGRPVARHLDDGWTVEVNRVATDGTPNACSALYGAARRIAFAMGYRRIITYTLPQESGASLRGAGWQITETSAGGGPWNCKSRPRVDTAPLQTKIRWEAQ